MQQLTVSTDDNPPYLRLSVFYLMYFAALGVFVPYWTLYLRNEGDFSPAEIGELMAVFMLTKVIAPLVWGWVADHIGARLRLIRLAAFITIICFAGTYFVDGYLGMLLVMAGFGFFYNASLPQFEALTLNHLGSHINRYSWIRLWGSIGFIVTVAGLSFFLESQHIVLVLDSLMVLFIAVWLSTLLVKDKPHEAHHFSVGRLQDVLRSPPVWALLVACALQQGSHGVYYTFFSIYLEDHGYSRVFTGWMWALGVIAEVVLFVFMYRLIQQYGAARLFALAMLLTAIRWVMLGSLVHNLPMLLFAQVLHAATYGLFHASAIHLIHHYFPGRLQGRGQALYAGISFGVGGALGSLLSGYAWDGMGAAMTFYLAAIVAVLGWLLALLYVREGEEQYVQR